MRIKERGYSWLKAPRYEGLPYETGALARMWVGGQYRRGISVMDRHQARAQEARLVAYAMRDWLGQLNLGQPFFASLPLPQSGSGIGLTEAPRGALGHWVQVTNRAGSSVPDRHAHLLELLAPRRRRGAGAAGEGPGECDRGRWRAPGGGAARGALVRPVLGVCGALGKRSHLA